MAQSLQVCQAQRFHLVDGQRHLLKLAGGDARGLEQHGSRQARDDSLERRPAHAQAPRAELARPDGVSWPGAGSCGGASDSSGSTSSAVGGSRRRYASPACRRAARREAASVQAARRRTGRDRPSGLRRSSARYATAAAATPVARGRLNPGPRPSRRRRRRPSPCPVQVSMVLQLYAVKRRLSCGQSQRHHGRHRPPHRRRGRRQVRVYRLRHLCRCQGRRRHPDAPAP